MASVSNEESQDRGRRNRGAIFETTEWSVVFAAGAESTTTSRSAMGQLCERYWYPLYFYARRRSYSPEDARDLTQDFFAELLGKDLVGRADREKGKFRAFLLTAFKRHIGHEREKAHAQKRGGGQVPLSLDFDAAEGRYRLEPADGLTPEKVFERHWVMTLLAQVLARLKEECAESGKGEFFERAKGLLTGEEAPPSYSKMGAELGITEGAVKVAVHRLRRRFAQLLRLEVAQTLANPDDIDEEIQYLFSVFG